MADAMPSGIVISAVVSPADRSALRVLGERRRRRFSILVSGMEQVGSFGFRYPTGEFMLPVFPCGALIQSLKN